MATAREMVPHLVRDGLSLVPEIEAVRDAPDGGGVCRVPNPVGKAAAWVVTRYPDVRAVLSDAETFSSSLSGSAFTPNPGDDDPSAGFLLTNDPPEHTRLRRMVSAEFTVRRVRALEPRITEIVNTTLDELAAMPKPADLISAFALPVPSLVICELLGVPHADRDQFQRRTARQALGVLNAEDNARLAGESRAYMRTLVDRAFADPGEDMLGMLVREHGGELSRAELADIAGLLLFAGHETTASILGLGTFVLLQHPEQCERMRDDPAAVGPAVEELLRFCSVLQMAIPRTAVRDTVLNGHSVAAGDLVMVSLSVANRDPLLLAGGTTFDIGRKPVSHVAFGFGVHHCLGAGLARAEMTIALPALLRRFPDLAVAVPPEELTYRPPHAFFGLETLPVTW